MKKTHRNYAVAAFVFGTACVFNLTPAFAAESNATTAPSVPLRGEISLQYGQSNGALVDVDGNAEVCVTSSSFESMPTGNVGNGLQHCHDLLTQPVHLNVQLDGVKLDLPITSVGNKQLNLSGIVDTGSGGVTLNALQIFPQSLVTKAGFNFNGDNQIVYKGITVTKLVATRKYGGQSADATSRTGNLGFAHVILGENGKVRTAMIPILFVYTSTVQPTTTSGDLDNTIGINGEMDAIGSEVSFDGQPIEKTSDTSTMVGQECTMQSTSACSLASPLRALSYSQGLQAGYILEDLPLLDGQTGKYLTVGLDQHNTKGFASVQLQCVTSSFAIEACNQEIRGANVMTSAGLNFTWNVIFDSGRPNVGLTEPVNSSTPPPPSPLPVGQTVTVTPPNQAGYTYSFTTGTGFAATTLTSIDDKAEDAAGTYSNMGLEFFATNSLMLDYDKGIEGWKAASNTSK